jgi:hypothetical protein
LRNIAEWGIFITVQNPPVNLKTAVRETVPAGSNPSPSAIQSAFPVIYEFVSNGRYVFGQIREHSKRKVTGENSPPPVPAEIAPVFSPAEFGSLFPRSRT